MYLYVSMHVVEAWSSNDSNLLSKIESYTLWNVQEREQVRSPVDRSATEEPLTPEAKQLEIEGRKKLSSDGGGEDRQ